MAPVAYIIELRDPLGNHLLTLDRFLRLTYSMTTNAVGELQVVLPGDIDSSLLGEDYRIEVWRRMDNQDPYLDGDQQWFIRKVEQTFPARAPSTYIVTAVSALDLLRRRIIAYYSGSSQAFQIGYATATLANLVRDNLVAIDTAVRDPRTGGIAQTIGANLDAYLAIAPTTDSAILVGKACARDNLLTTCQEVANTSAQDGQYVAFDVIWNGTILVFQTYLDQRGADRRFPGGTNPILLSPDFGSFADMTFIRDYTKEITVAIAGGPGGASARAIQVDYDPVRVVASPFNRIESLVVGSQSTTDGSLLDAATSAVRSGRPRISFVGRIQQTSGVQYGRDWGWGDYLTASNGDINIDARVDAVTVTFESGEETIEAWLRGEQ